MATGTIKRDNAVFATVCNIKPSKYIGSDGTETVWMAYYLAEIPVQPNYYINVLNSAGNDGSYNKFIDINGSQVGSLIRNRNTTGFGQAYQVPSNAVSLLVSMFIGQKQVLIDYYSQS